MTKGFILTLIIFCLFGKSLYGQIIHHTDFKNICNIESVVLVCPYKYGYLMKNEWNKDSRIIKSRTFEKDKNTGECLTYIIDQTKYEEHRIPLNTLIQVIFIMSIQNYLEYSNDECLDTNKDTIYVDTKFNFYYNNKYMLISEDDKSIFMSLISLANIQYIYYTVPDDFLKYSLKVEIASRIYVRNLFYNAKID